MNADQITFGCEIECFIPAAQFAAAGLVVGSYHNGRQLPGFPAGWNGQRDGSLAAPSDHVAIEIVSPVLKGVDGLRQVLAVVAKIKALGGKVNASCGFHVHVGWGYERQAELPKVVRLVANYEKALFASTGTHSRERGMYCESIKAKFKPYFHDGREDRALAAHNRYHVLNVSNVIGEQKPTVEFRVFAGTLNETKIAGYVRLAIGMVEKALKMKRQAAWDAKPNVATSPMTRGGEGQTQLNRLMYALGWTKGREPQTFGGLEGDGVPSIESSKRLLMKLAAKYDGPAEMTPASDPGPATQD